jgi:probable HAF family extracellular repeat protein
MLGLLIAAWLGAARSPAAAAGCLPFYRVVPLGPIDNGTYADESLNERGQVAGATLDAAGFPYPFLWHAGTLTPLDHSFATWYPYDINDFGVIVGDTDAGQPVIWRDGTPTLLPTPTQTDATSINDAGEVYGEQFSLDGSRSRLVRYRAGHWHVLRLPSNTLFVRPMDSPAWASVVGTITDPTTSHAFYWNRGTFTLYPGADGYPFSGANDGNRREQSTGWVENNTGNFRAAVFTNGRTRVLPTLGGDFGNGQAINDYGTSVGWSTDRAGDQHGFVYRRGRIVNLENAVPKRFQLSFMLPWDINDRGRILVQADNPNGGGLYLLKPARNRCG